jgi:hypothetical protein
MRTPAEAGTPLTLIIQRLMDADLLLPEEGSALLAEVEAFEQEQDKTIDIESRASEGREAFLASLEALLQTRSQDASIAGQAQAIVRQILRREGDQSESDPA